MQLDPVIVVGMCPSHKPLLGNKTNASLRKLHSWMDSLNVYHYSFINTFDYPANPRISNVDFSVLEKACLGYNKILALGGFVSDVLNRIEVEHFSLPHPSPLNRLLNDKKYEDKILKQCKEYLI